MNEPNQTGDSQIQRRRNLIRVLLALLCVWGLVTAVRFIWPADSLAIARQAAKTGQYAQAVDAYRVYLESEPTDWEARAELGVVLGEVDRPAALDELEMIPPTARVFGQTQRELVRLCLASGRQRRAEEALKRLALHEPTDFVTHFTLGKMLFMQLRHKEALPYVEEAARLTPDDPAAHFLLAELYDELGRIGEMAAPLERVIELDLDNYAAHLNLAYAYSSAGQPESAVREAKWCLARNPSDTAAMRFLARAAIDNGEHDAAMADVKRILELTPLDLDTRLLEAEILLFQRDGKLALERLQPLVESNQKERRLFSMLARAATGAKQPELAAEYRKQVKALSQ